MTKINSILEEDILSDIVERTELLLNTKTICLKYSFSLEDEQFFLNYSIHNREIAYAHSGERRRHFMRNLKLQVI